MTKILVVIVAVFLCHSVTCSPTKKYRKFENLNLTYPDQWPEVAALQQYVQFADEKHGEYSN